MGCVKMFSAVLRLPLINSIIFIPPPPPYLTPSLCFVESAMAGEDAGYVGHVAGERPLRSGERAQARLGCEGHQGTETVIVVLEVLLCTLFICIE